MIYTPDWDIYKEKFFMDGESHEQFDKKSPYSEIKNKIEFVKSVLVKMVQHMRSSVDEEAPRQFPFGQGFALVETRRIGTRP